MDRWLPHNGVRGAAPVLTNPARRTYRAHRSSRALTSTPAGPVALPSPPQMIGRTTVRPRRTLVKNEESA